MPSIDSLVSLNITVSSAQPTQANFGTPIILAYHTHHTNKRVLTYSTPDAMVSDGWATTEAGYLAALALCSQNPRPPSFKIGRRASAWTKVVHVFPEITTAGYVYSGTCAGQTWTYTNGNSETLATITTALAAIFTALSNVSATASGGTHVIITADAAGFLFDVVSLGDSHDDVKIYDMTTDPGIAADIAAVKLEDSDWYGMVLDSNSKNEILAAAPVIEATRKILVVHSGDADTRDSGLSTDVFSQLDTAGYLRTISIFHHKPGSQWAAAAWLSGRLTATPGSDTWAFKTLAGVDVSSAKYMTDAEADTLDSQKNASWYASVGGLSMTFQGKTSSGSYADITRFVDWLYATIQIRVLFTLSQQPKVPFTDSGIDLIASAIRGVLKQGVTNGGLNGGDDGIAPPLVFAPKAKDVPSTDRAARKLTGITFSGILTGAIHTVGPINGSLSVAA